MYLESAQVKCVYPTAYRDPTYDAQADNTTEYNVVNAIKRIGNRSFVFFYDDTVVGATDIALKVSIGGYAFEITKAGVAALQTERDSGNLYLFIRVGGATENESQLLPAVGEESSVSSLDVEEGAVSKFQGLGISTTDGEGYLHLFNEEGKIPTSSYCILDTTQIIDDSGKPIFEKLTTSELGVSGPATITGILSVKGSDDAPEIAFINKSNDKKVTLTSSMATANRTITLPNKSGEVLLVGTSKTPSATENVVKSIATESSSVLTGVTISKDNVINGVSSTAKNAYTTLNTSATGISSSSFNSSTGVLTLTSGNVVTGGSTTSMIQTVSSTTSQVVTDVTTPAGNKTSVISAVTPTAVDVASSSHTHEINNQ